MPVKGVPVERAKPWGSYLGKVPFVLVISSTKSHRHVCQSGVCPFNVCSTWGYYIEKVPFVLVISSFSATPRKGKIITEN